MNDDVVDLAGLRPVRQVVVAVVAVTELLVRRGQPLAPERRRALHAGIVSRSTCRQRQLADLRLVRRDGNRLHHDLLPGVRRTGGTARHDPVDVVSELRRGHSVRGFRVRRHCAVPLGRRGVGTDRQAERALVRRQQRSTASDVGSGVIAQGNRVQPGQLGRLVQSPQRRGRRDFLLAGQVDHLAGVDSGEVHRAVATRRAGRTLMVVPPGLGVRHGKQYGLRYAVLRCSCTERRRGHGGRTRGRGTSRWTAGRHAGQGYGQRYRCQGGENLRTTHGVLLNPTRRIPVARLASLWVEKAHMSTANQNSPSAVQY